MLRSRRTGAFRLLFLLSVLLSFSCFLLCSCSSKTAGSEILVSAAVSLEDVMLQLGREFEEEHPDCKVRFNFGASGQLCRQIAQGAPVDLFISASASQIDELKRDGLLQEDSIHNCAGNRLVVLSCKELHLSALQELVRLDRIALGNPKTVPAGDYARQALETAGVYDKLEQAGKLVFAEDARQILAYAEGKDVEAGIVYNTDAMLAVRAKVCFSIPRSYTRAMHYQIATLKGSRHRQLALEFLNFVIGERGRAAFQKRGFDS